MRWDVLSTFLLFSVSLGYFCRSQIRISTIGDKPPSYVTPTGPPVISNDHGGNLKKTASRISESTLHRAQCRCCQSQGSSGVSVDPISPPSGRRTRPFVDSSPPQQFRAAEWRHKTVANVGVRTNCEIADPNSFGNVRFVNVFTVLYTREFTILVIIVWL